MSRCCQQDDKIRFRTQGSTSRGLRSKEPDFACPDLTCGRWADSVRETIKFRQDNKAALDEACRPGGLAPHEEIVSVVQTLFFPCAENLSDISCEWRHCGCISDLSIFLAQLALCISSRIFLLQEISHIMFHPWSILLHMVHFSWKISCFREIRRWEEFFLGRLLARIQIFFPRIVNREKKVEICTQSFPQEKNIKNIIQWPSYRTIISETKFTKPFKTSLKRTIAETTISLWNINKKILQMQSLPKRSYWNFQRGKIFWIFPRFRKFLLLRWQSESASKRHFSLAVQQVPNCWCWRISWRTWAYLCCSHRTQQHQGPDAHSQRGTSECVSAVCIKRRVHANFPQSSCIESNFLLAVLKAHEYWKFLNVVTQREETHIIWLKVH